MRVPVEEAVFEHLRQEQPDELAGKLARVVGAIAGVSRSAVAWTALHRQNAGRRQIPKDPRDNYRCVVLEISAESVGVSTLAPKVQLGGNRLGKFLNQLDRREPATLGDVPLKLAG
jgi:hypothetical protein